MTLAEAGWNEFLNSLLQSLSEPLTFNLISHRPVAWAAFSTDLIVECFFSSQSRRKNQHSLEHILSFGNTLKKIRVMH